MKILVINGSPKGQKSNTIKLTHAFIEGIMSSDKNTEIREIDVCSKKIGSCKGCFCCWNKTPGNCIIADDMREVLINELWADLIIWSFPLYYFSVPGILKNLMDRQLPLSLPFMAERSDNVGNGSHPSRYDRHNQKHVVISTCGFYTADKNYESVKMMFNHICGAGQFETIFCGQGELFRVPELKGRTDEYLTIVKRAGNEYAQGAITRETRTALSALLYPKEVFEKMADASWGVSKDGQNTVDETLSFTRQMAALYNKASYDGKDKVLEITYTDKGKSYQILLSSDGSQVFEDCHLDPTTKIETPWNVWTQISRHEIRGDAALMQGLYRVTGDFNLMIHWDDYFGTSGSGTSSNSGNRTSRGVSSLSSQSVKTSAKRKPSMITLLLPWMVFWIGTSVNPQTGPLLVLLLCAAIPLFTWFMQLTIYDVISIFITGLLSSFILFGGNPDTAYLLAYLSFGLMWLLSCFTREPLCAAYVKYDYNGDDALNNPIFMKTNVILAAGWGILYILVTVFTFILWHFNLSMIAIILANAAPILMGIFTGWFQNWYPAHVAAGR